MPNDLTYPSKWPVQVETIWIYLFLLCAVFIISYVTTNKAKSPIRYAHKFLQTKLPVLRRRSTILPPDFANIVPYRGLPTGDRPDPDHPWKPGKYHMTMGLRKLDINRYLVIDKNWEEWHREKLAWLDGPMHDEVVQVLPNADEACEELLEMVVEYVTRRYPDMFVRDKDYIEVKPVKERYRIRKPFDRHPMDVAGLLVQDDFWLLQKGERDLYYLRAAWIGCPAGFHVSDKIGWPLHQIHAPVPAWKQKLKLSMERFFTNLKVEAPMQRNNVFIQPCPGRFQLEPMTSKQKATNIDQVEIRTELQGLRRLPKTGAIIFTVRAYMVPITDLEPEPLHKVWDAIRNYPDATAAYKVRDLWEDVFEAHCREVLGQAHPTLSSEPADTQVP